MVKLAAFSTDQKSVEYHNQDQRNVHIWGPFQPGLKSSERDLIAGFWNHDNRVTYAMLYKWLDLLIEPLNTNDQTSYPNMQPSFGLARFKDLLNVDSEDSELDPRAKDGAFPPQRAREEDVTRSLITHCIGRDDSNPCVEGHYLIFYGHFGVKKEGGKLLEVLKVPVLEEVPTVEESIFEATGLKERKSNSRKPAFRRTIRERDGCCIITKTGFMKRTRGNDYTGLEAAHLFPVAWVGKANAYLFKKKKRLVRHLVEDNDGANKARNGILLRVDIHRLFDQHVWSIYEDKVYVFERARPNTMGEGSPCLETTFEQFKSPPDRVGLNDTREVDGDGTYSVPGTVPSEPPEPALMQFHFICALHKNIVDLGREKQKGN